MHACQDANYQCTYQVINANQHDIHLFQLGVFVLVYKLCSTN